MRIDTDLIAVAAENNIWKKVDEYIDSKQPAKYDEAVKLLVDLQDLNKKTGTEKDQGTAECKKNKKGAEKTKLP